MTVAKNHQNKQIKPGSQPRISSPNTEGGSHNSVPLNLQVAREHHQLPTRLSIHRDHKLLIKILMSIHCSQNSLPSLTRKNRSKKLHLRNPLMFQSTKTSIQHTLPARAAWQKEMYQGRRRRNTKRC